MAFTEDDAISRRAARPCSSCQNWRVNACDSEVQDIRAQFDIHQGVLLLLCAAHHAGDRSAVLSLQ